MTIPGPAPAEIGDRLFGSANAAGNGRLWVGGLGDGGVIVADPALVDSHGAIHWKFGWWRGAPGKLTITVRRLDGPAAPPVASVPDGYGTSGFQPSSVAFTAEGCWEVAGTLGASTLRFVSVVTVAGEP